MVNNIFKNGPITSICGVVVLLGTVYAVEFDGSIDWKWNGAIGAGLGCALLLAPDDLKNGLSSLINGAVNIILKRK